MMDIFNVPENVKPSRVNRKRKRRWKIGTALSQLTQPKIRLGSKALTDCGRIAQNKPTAPHWAVGRENLFINGVKPPLTIAVFLCASYCPAVMPSILYGGLFGQLSSWLASIDQYSHPTQTAAQAVRSLIGGLHPSSME